MRLIALVIALLWAVPSVAQTTSIMRVGTGEGAYRYAEVIQEAGRWVPLDAGYIGDTHGYHEFYIGGGRTLIASDRLRLIGIAFLDQNNQKQTNVIPWALVTATPTHDISLSANWFSYFGEGPTQHYLEHSKIEYLFPFKVKAGIGYAGSKFGTDAWKNKPLITGTLVGTPVGDVEVWGQRLPGNKLSMQLRVVTGW